MTIAFLSAGNKGGVNSILEGFQQMECIYFPGALKFYYSYIGSIFHTHGACQISSRIGTIMTSEGYYLRLKSTCHDPLLSQLGRTQDMGFCHHLLIFVVL